MESFLSLAIAVVIFRGFGAEGYLISTGSMAPTLLGYHHHISCPECRFEFERGALPPDSSPSLSAGGAELGGSGALLVQAHCPNCGLQNILLDQPRATEGDQLLVQKLAYEFRDPRRWEVIVFGNPSDPRQAYVKRLVGLPEESMEILHGDAFANGKLCRKPWSVQLATRQIVSDAAAIPDTQDPQWHERWITNEEQSDWQQLNGQWTFTPGQAVADKATRWIEYRHWVRGGGRHETRVPLAALPTGIDRSELQFPPLRFEQGELVATGVFTSLELDWWRNRSTNPEFAAALEELAFRSHIAPIVDECDYNARNEEEHVVDDLCLSATITHAAHDGRCELALQHVGKEYRGVVRFDLNRVELLGEDSPTPLAGADLPANWRETPLVLDLSVIDDQIILAINEVPIAHALELPESPPVPRRRPARIGASGGACTLSQLRLYRDIYYTPKGSTDRVVVLAPDQFFVLGDNSPVSLDSRAWEDPAVPRDALIGKPIIVHLPSRTGRINWRGESRPVRLPDFAKVRLIR